MEKPKNFNNSKTFEKELQDILFELLQDKIKHIIKCGIEEHDIKPIKELLSLANSHGQYED